jgi:hypothetical protein
VSASWRSLRSPKNWTRRTPCQIGENSIVAQMEIRGFLRASL